MDSLLVSCLFLILFLLHLPSSSLSTQISLLSLFRSHQTRLSSLLFLLRFHSRAGTMFVYLSTLNSQLLSCLALSGQSTSRVKCCCRSRIRSDRHSYAVESLVATAVTSSKSRLTTSGLGRRSSSAASSQWAPRSHRAFPEAARS